MKPGTHNYSFSVERLLMKSKTWSNRVENKFRDVIMLPLGPKLKLGHDYTACNYLLFHHALIVHSVTDVNIRYIGETRYSGIQIHYICILVIVCHKGGNPLGSQTNLIKRTFIRVVFPLPAIPITIQHVGWLGVGSLISDMGKKRE